MAGKPHLGTDRLIRILQAFRKHLTALGVKIHFGTCAMGLHVQHDRVAGVTLKGAKTLACVSCAAHSDQGHCMEPMGLQCHEVWFQTTHARCTYSMALAICKMQYGRCSMAHAVWYTQLGTCSMALAAWYMQPGTCSMTYAACTYRMTHAACYMQDGICSMALCLHYGALRT